jgi:ribose transport system ATP-binding protein
MCAGEIMWSGPLEATSLEELVGLIAETGEGDGRAADGTEAVGGPAPLGGRASYPGPVILEARDVFGRWLRGVSLSVRAGEIVGIAGLLGSGREELPYILAGGKTEGVSGSFVVDGARHSVLPIATARELGLALVPADRAREAIFGEFSAGENVSLPGLAALSRSGVFHPRAERRFARRWLTAVHADERVADRAITTLSGGNQQKAVLARWLSVAPRVLVLSEPTAGVDIGARVAIYEELRRRAAEDGLAVVMASSDAEDLLSTCHRVIVLRDGVVVSEVAGNEINKSTIVGAMEGIEA